MTEQLANNAASTLSGGIDNLASSLVVANGSVFPSTGNFRILVDSELMLVGARSGTTLSSLTRGIEATTAASHSNGAQVTHVLSAGGLAQFTTEKIAGSTIAIAQLAGYPSDASKLLTGNATWVNPFGFGTSLPGSPVDGQFFILADSAVAPTYQWMLRYVSAKASNKWICIGGAAISSEVAAKETTASTGYTALGTPGPSVTVPVAGDYFVSIGATLQNSGVTGDTVTYMSYDIGGTGAVDADSVNTTHKAANIDATGWSVSRTMKKTGLTAVTLTAKYRIASTDTLRASKRWMTLMPIAIGG